MHKVHLVDIGWLIARLTVDSNPSLAYIEVIDPPSNAYSHASCLRLQPEQAVRLAHAILEHYSPRPLEGKLNMPIG